MRNIYLNRSAEVYDTEQLSLRQKKNNKQPKVTFVNHVTWEPRILFAYYIVMSLLRELLNDRTQKKLSYFA